MGRGPGPKGMRPSACKTPVRGPRVRAFSQAHIQDFQPEAVMARLLHFPRKQWRPGPASYLPKPNVRALIQCRKQ